MDSEDLNVLQMILGIPQSPGPPVNLTPEPSRAMDCIIKCCVKSSCVDTLPPFCPQEKGKNWNLKKTHSCFGWMSGVLKGFVHFKCFADCKIPYDDLRRALSLQFSSAMILAWITL